MNFYNMKDTKKVGEKGVNIVLTALRVRQPPFNFLTLNRQNNRKAGYDIELVSRQNPFTPNWVSKKLEVKTDRRDPINFFIELVSQEEIGRVGGFLDTPADFILYLFLKSRRLYVFDVPALKRWIVRNQQGYSSTPVRTPTGNDYFTTSGIVVPIHDLLHLNLSVEQLYDAVLTSLAAA